MIDLNENLLTLRDACKLVPGRGGRPLSLPTIHRWCTHGVRGIRLETTQAGGQRVTTRSALHRFFDALQRADSAASASTSATTSSTPTRGRPSVSDQLDAIGI